MIKQCIFAYIPVERQFVRLCKGVRGKLFLIILEITGCKVIPCILGQCILWSCYFLEIPGGFFNIFSFIIGKSQDIIIITFETCFCTPMILLKIRKGFCVFIGIEKRFPQYFCQFCSTLFRCIDNEWRCLPDHCFVITLHITDLNHIIRGNGLKVGIIQ